MILDWLDLGFCPIFKQLEIEEALLRTHSGNVCVINRGSPRAIVMGISGVPEKLIDIPKVREHSVPVIKRFSGGGTVIVDEETLFVSFLFGKDVLPIAPFPEPILRWSAELYAKSWNIDGFGLQENDYVIGTKKCGGNAQYLKKDRWLHHTSFLWDYKPENMGYLLMPDKRPKYREDRHHNEFLCRLKEHCVSKEGLVKQLREQLAQQFRVVDFVLPNTWPEHRKALQSLKL